MSSTFALSRYIKECTKEYMEILKYVTDSKSRFKYECYIEALKKLDEKISIDFDYNNSGIIRDVLTANFGKNDVQFIGWDDEEILYVKKNTVTMVQDNFLCILGDESIFEKQVKTGDFPVIFKALNLDNIKEFKVIGEE